MTSRLPNPTTGPGVPSKPSRLAAIFRVTDANPRYAWTTRRRNRLLLVAIQAAVLTAALVLLPLERPGWAFVMFLPFFPLMSLINIGIHGLLDIPVAHLDEVMAQIRTEAKARAHTILVVLIGLMLVGALNGATFIGERFADDPRAATLVAQSAALGLFFVAMLLPTWILTWRLPDQDAASVDTVPQHTLAHHDEPA